jgi:hypothetical protein
MPKAGYHSKSFVIYLDAQKVWEYIEMGKDIDELYPDEFKTETVLEQNYKKATQILEDGEQFVFLDFTHGDYIITSYARVYNFKHNRFIGLQNNKKIKKELNVIIRDKKISLRELFEQQGWKFNYDELTQRQFKSSKRN